MIQIDLVDISLIKLFKPTLKAIIAIPIDPEIQKNWSMDLDAMIPQINKEKLIDMKEIS